MSRMMGAREVEDLSSAADMNIEASGETQAGTERVIWVMAIIVLSRSAWKAEVKVKRAISRTNIQITPREMRETFM